ncbi:MAG TPA: hypothetical protein VLA13_04535, partial [Massilibacterium sp.]|nr:hypothetical protein [Massilibacterium sp.]
GWFYFPVGSYVNSPFSVQYINNKAVPWLECVYGGEKLWAGATIKEFVKYIENNEGEVFYPIRKITEKSINFYETN